MNAKFSPLIRAGAIVHSADGSVFRCTSKLASEGTVRYCFADLQGKPVQPPTDFFPVTAALARHAAWMRYIVAFNKDFDQYVKEYIRESGLPVDETMNWAKWFAAVIAPKLMSRDEEEQDEAIHHIIINALAKRKVLSRFEERIHSFPEKTQSETLERQVTLFLIQTFMWRVEEANNYIKKVMRQENTDSMWSPGNDDSKEVNVLDTEEHASEGEYEAVETDIDINHFRSFFVNWLNTNIGESQATRYVVLFDLIYDAFKASESVKQSTLFEEWNAEIGADPVVFKKVWRDFPKLIDIAIKRQGKGYRPNPFLEIMRQIGKKQKAMAVAASAKTAEDKCALCGETRTSNKGHKCNSNCCSCHRTPDKKVAGPVADFLNPPPDSGSQDDKGKSFNMQAPISGEGEGAIGAIGGDTLAELGGMALAASAHTAKMWESPTCKGCGKGNNPTECPACKGLFCGDCVLNHHANNPSHDRVGN
jgi:hypothetical protein